MTTNRTESARPARTVSRRRLTAGSGALTTTLRVPVLAFLVHVVVVFGAAAAGVAWAASMPPVPAVGYEARPMTGLGALLVQPLRNWDGVWYAVIAEHGYEVHPATTAFWPLYPLMLRYGSQLTDWTVPVVGVVLSNVAFLLALIVLHRLVRIDYGDAVAGRTTWLVALFPTAFFFSATYTEALFLLLTVTAIYFGRTDRWGLAGLTGLLAGATRNTGFLVLIPLGLLLIRRYGWNPGRWWRNAVKLAAVPIGPALYLLYLDRLWGNPLITLDVQREWERYRALPWETVATALRAVDLSWFDRLLANPSWATLTSTGVRTSFANGGVLDLAVLATFVPLALYMLVRVRPAYSLYAVVSLTIPLFSPSTINALLSISRFVLVLFPFFIALGLLLTNRWVFRAVLAVSTLLLVILTVQFATWYWVA